jgi:hypothetical protein
MKALRFWNAAMRCTVPAWVAGGPVLPQTAQLGTTATRLASRTLHNRKGFETRLYG